MDFLIRLPDLAAFERVKAFIAETDPGANCFSYANEEVASAHANFDAPVSKKYKHRFLSKIGSHIHSLTIDQVAYFFTENKSNFICKNDGRRYPIDQNLDQIVQVLNEELFFRVNRQFIIGHHAIEEMTLHSRSRLIINLNPPSKYTIVVAVERANDFRKWLSQ